MEIRIDKGIYSREVLLKTAYSFTDKAYLHLSQDDSSWIISWTNMPDHEVNPEMFENEMISQQLRAEIVRKTKDIRKLLLSRAFASSVLEMTNADVSESEEKGIALSDEGEEENAMDILKGWFDE